ncbi:bifunctional tetrahydrofolate synthase/dihydrofolate synthase [Neptuniibacter sp. CAU 1671]|uniref:bifunctional tetrahydrofolate synthase/dihydrofolate synthase n=1 Tax=Neptuniibacter sp. CAU 1671 TaxID=3032593 RepID=UPI0023DA12BA|nr:bifunctional tetrahydrofolate synthase/dihydrofolate synthase [Neptuniibacter sp. CAU 1671]MDF2182954.1 bifunctional tetrahydrofolate synthase/dihydrofolate synthase [Neptuniibacter sp. CAU 1671]
MAQEINPQQRTLEQWLTWMEQCHPSEIELGLDRVRQVSERLAVDLSASQVVTIAGTNGKGSTVRYLQTIYSSAGYSVGCYTSPHFLYYNERVELNGQPVSDQLLCDAFYAIDQARGQIPLTYFEFGTLAALLIFSQTKPDLVLLEVGLGGRLDAVNIIDPDIAVITTVALDHQDWLGDTREAIGFEKAGIFRTGIPAVCGDPDLPESVLKHANSLKAPLYRAGIEFHINCDGDLCQFKGKGVDGTAVSLADIPRPELPLPNAATALQVCQLLPLVISEDQKRVGIAQARLTGRMQKVSYQGINFCLDVAHNPEAAGLLADRLALWDKPILILGMLKDKDRAAVVEALLPVISEWHLVDLDTPRGGTAAELASFLPDDVKPYQHATVTDAINYLVNSEKPLQDVMIAGSFYTVAEALSVLKRD